MCFPVNFVKCLRAPFLQNTYRRLLLNLLDFAQFGHLFYVFHVSKFCIINFKKPSLIVFFLHPRRLVFFFNPR